MYQQFPPTNHIGAGMICYADSRSTAENPYFTRLYKERQRSSGKWSDLRRGVNGAQGRNRTTDTMIFSHVLYQLSYLGTRGARSEEQRSELQSLMRNSYAVI